MDQKYFVVLSPDQKFGPADLELLNQWATEGRILPNTILENEVSGQQIPASQLTGLVLPQPPADAPAQPSAPSNPYDPIQPTPKNPLQDTPSMSGPASNPFQNNPYQTPPTPQAAYQRYAPPLDDGSGDITKSYIFSILGFVCCCFVLPAGIYFGNEAKKKGNPGGNAATIVAWILTGLYALGIIGYLVFVFAIVGTGGF